MAKIPVGATIAHAYRFAFTNCIAIFKAIWMASLAGLVLGFFMRDQVLVLQEALDAGQFAVAGQRVFMLLPFYALTALLFFMQQEGATRVALGLMPDDGRPFYLQLGRPLWRLAGQTLLAFLVLMLAVLGAFVALGLLGALSTVIAGDAGKTAAILIGMVAALAGYGALIYAAIRLFFFLAPTAIAETDGGVVRSWALGRGNFWRIVGVCIAVLGPLMLISVIVLLSWTGLPPFSVPGEDPEVTRQASRAWQQSMAALMQDRWYVVYPVSFVLSVLTFGLVCGAQAHAYRAVTQGDGPWSSASRR